MISLELRACELVTKVPSSGDAAEQTSGTSSSGPLLASRHP